MADSATILVVEDDRDLRESLCEVLDDEGYRSVPAATGAEALQLVRDGVQPSVVLLDLMMPEMNGWEFREAQLADQDIAAIPVVVMTARRNLHRRPIDADELLFKPLDLGDLLEVVARAIP